MRSDAAAALTCAFARFATRASSPRSRWLAGRSLRLPAQALAARHGRSRQGGRDDRRLRRREPDDRGPDRADLERADRACRPQGAPACEVRGRAAVRPCAARSARSTWAARRARAASERFSNLRAQSYSGHRALSLGARLADRRCPGSCGRSKARVGGRRGKAFCSIKVGRQAGGHAAAGYHADPERRRLAPRPAQCPLLRLRRPVRRHSSSSRASTAGPFVRGRAVTRSRARASHTLEYAARDAAGNQTPTAADHAADRRGRADDPDGHRAGGLDRRQHARHHLDASTDSGSGVAGYVVLVRDSGGAIVWSQDVPARAPRAVTVGQTLARATTQRRSSRTTARRRSRSPRPGPARSRSTLRAAPRSRASRRTARRSPARAGGRRPAPRAAAATARTTARARPTRSSSASVAQPAILIGSAPRQVRTSSHSGDGGERERVRRAHGVAVVEPVARQDGAEQLGRLVRERPARGALLVVRAAGRARRARPPRSRRRRPPRSRPRPPRPRRPRTRRAGPAGDEERHHQPRRRLDPGGERGRGARRGRAARRPRRARRPS